MSFKDIFKISSRDTAYDHRKVLNSEDIIKIINSMGYKHAEIGDICGVSKTMISHWGNHNKSEKPTYAQLEPILEHCGSGRFKCELEPLPESAIEYREIDKRLSNLFLSIFAVSMLLIVSITTIKPCYDNWTECKKLPWYRMAAYDVIKFKEDMKEFKEWRKATKESMELKVTP